MDTRHTHVDIMRAWWTQGEIKRTADKGETVIRKIGEKYTIQQMDYFWYLDPEKDRVVGGIPLLPSA